MGEYQFARYLPGVTHKRKEERRLPYSGQSFNLWSRPGLQNAFFACKNAFVDQRKALVQGEGGIDIIFYVNFATISVINFVKNNFFRYFFKLCPYFIDKELSRVLQLYTELINKYGIR